METDPRYVTAAPPKHIDKCRVDSVLDNDHQKVFTTALSNILRTKVAETTLAQIVDGLPLEHIAFSLRGHRYTSDDPVATHIELCPGSIEKSRAFRERFDPVLMTVRTDVLERYQAVPVGSRASQPVLIELVAVAVHAIAVKLFKLDSHGPHKKDTPCPVKDPYAEAEADIRRRFQPWPTSFAVTSYTDVEQYPDGVADLAGYWAESLIFGGVVLFGRGESGSGYDGVWFHSHRKDATRRIYALTDDQTATLLRFLTREAGSPDHGDIDSECPFPILGDSNNRRRVDPEIAMPEHNVFRDRWERKMAFRSYEQYEQNSSCVKNSLDYPEMVSDWNKRLWFGQTRKGQRESETK
ncbi:hypothetical protein SLS63_009722 [Diaporthe eres]|uniref:Uncharacterized protein n=1 Tax=Diaporthe eres TaxID=83184 RepID=A0ABR1NZ63_DIAER